MSDRESRLTPLAPAQRDLFRSPAHHFVRLSFGPNMKTLDKGEWRSCFLPVGMDPIETQRRRSLAGLDAIERVLSKTKQAPHLMGKS